MAMLRNLGYALRETALMLDRLGSRLTGSWAFREELNRHRTLMSLKDKVPAIASDTFVAPSAAVIGDVKIGPGASVWYGAVVRGDAGAVTIGESTNVQDGAILHLSPGTTPGAAPGLSVGARVTIGHGAAVQSSTIGDEAIIGMGAVIEEGCTVSTHSILAAGSVLSAGTTVPTGQIWAGNPARYLRDLTQQEVAFIKAAASNYSALAKPHMDEASKTFEEVERDKAARNEKLRANVSTFPMNPNFDDPSHSWGSDIARAAEGRAGGDRADGRHQGVSAGAPDLEVEGGDCLSSRGV
ncbi:unnamed protein product [Pedinophyceae sp. YPF-701]|nr:unnamed protein product [Pedinophyceae sp. YPF-701]